MHIAWSPAGFRANSFTCSWESVSPSTLVEASQQLKEMGRGIKVGTVGRPGGVGPRSGRTCPGCGALLAADNMAGLCSRCLREQRDQLRAPAQFKNEFFETDEFRAAFESHHIGKVFKAYRNHPYHLQLFGKPLNQELLGRWLSLTQGQVSRIENGKPEQNIETLQNYTKILHIPHHLLWFDFPGESRFLAPAQNGDPQAGGQLMGRGWSINEFTQGDKSATSALISRVASESRSFGLGHDMYEVNASNMEQIEEEVIRLSVDFVEGDPFDTFIRSRQLRDTIFGLLEKRVFPRQQTDLYAFGARTCGYLAAASSDFYGQYQAGVDHCRVARQFSDISADLELRAWSLSLHSGICFWQGEWAQAAELAERASELAVTRSGVLRAVSMHVRALARLGNVERLATVVRASEARHADDQNDNEKGMILFSDTNYLRHLGTANLWAGESVKAREQLTVALESYLSESPENFAVIATIRADLAMSLLNERDVEGASETLGPLLSVAADRRLEGAIRRMRDLRSVLQSDVYAHSPVVKDLSLQIDEFLSNSRPVPAELD